MDLDSSLTGIRTWVGFSNIEWLSLKISPWGEKEETSFLFLHVKSNSNNLSGKEVIITCHIKKEESIDRESVQVFSIKLHLSDINHRSLRAPI